MPTPLRDDASAGASAMARRSNASRQADSLLRRGREFLAVVHHLSRTKRQDVAAELRTIADEIVTEQSA